jgi:hypothetical protein
MGKSINQQVVGIESFFLLFASQDRLTQENGCHRQVPDDPRDALEPTIGFDW